jgi:hypothetical protein
MTVMVVVMVMVSLPLLKPSTLVLSMVETQHLDGFIASQRGIRR